VPHVTLYALEDQLTGREPALIHELTSAVVSVYGEWVRSSVDVRLIGIPAGRWARGGTAVSTAAPSGTNLAVRARRAGHRRPVTGLTPVL
jgi:phenylpyruvate tautomerase PptA (4-oxalocrotonate tautomerase family)